MKEKVYVFGCGRYFDTKLQSVTDKYEIIEILDNNKDGQYIRINERDIPIIKPCKMKKDKKVIIMMAKFIVAELQLKELDIPKNNWIYPYEFEPFFKEEIQLLEERRKFKSDFLCTGGSVKPLNRTFGFSRGTPVDRWYIESWLNGKKEYIQKETLEIAEDTYTRRFGNENVISYILHVEPTNDSQIKGNLETGEGIVENSMDCVILTQTIPSIFQLHDVMSNLYKMLKRGGTALITCGGIMQISRFDMERWGHFWSLTDMSLKRLIEEQSFSDYEIEQFGNVKTACALLYGIAAEELSEEDLAYYDEDYPVSICARVTK